MQRKDLTQEKLKSCLDYDPGTGQFTYLPKDRSWFKSKSTYTHYNRYCAGNPVNGYVNDRGYVVIGIGKMTYLAHSLAILYMDGYYPEVVDHINHDKLDNRYVNLNPTTCKNNAQNRPIQKNNKSGYIGVGKVIKNGVWNNKWYAGIGIDGKEIKKSNFCTIEEAIAYREKLRQEHHKYAVEVQKKLNRSKKRKMNFKPPKRRTLNDFVVNDEKKSSKKNTKDSQKN